jgi:hypothetical protein
MTTEELACLYFDDEDLGPDRTRYRIEQNPQTGVITATIQAAAFDAKEALELAARTLTPEAIQDLADGFEEHKREARAR